MASTLVFASSIVLAGAVFITLSTLTDRPAAEPVELGRVVFHLSGSSTGVVAEPALSSDSIEPSRGAAL